jgi:hypothetical protein
VVLTQYRLNVVQQRACALKLTQGSLSKWLVVSVDSLTQFAHTNQQSYVEFLGFFECEAQCDV